MRGRHSAMRSTALRCPAIPPQPSPGIEGAAAFGPRQTKPGLQPQNDRESEGPVGVRPLLISPKLRPVREPTRPDRTFCRQAVGGDAPEPGRIDNLRRQSVPKSQTTHRVTRKKPSGTVSPGRRLNTGPKRAFQEHGFRSRSTGEPDRFATLIPFVSPTRKSGANRSSQKVMRKCSANQHAGECVVTDVDLSELATEARAAFRDSARRSGFG